MISSTSEVFVQQSCPATVGSPLGQNQLGCRLKRSGGGPAPGETPLGTSSRYDVCTNPGGAAYLPAIGMGPKTLPGGAKVGPFRRLRRENSGWATVPQLSTRRCLIGGRTVTLRRGSAAGQPSAPRGTCAPSSPGAKKRM